MRMLERRVWSWIEREGEREEGQLLGSLLTHRGQGDVLLVAGG